MSAALQSRLAKLEAATPTKPKSWINCFPFNESWHRDAEEIAPGILRVVDRYHTKPGNRDIAYLSREQLDEWLSLPAQTNDLHSVYQIITAESIAATLARIESEI